MKATIVAALAAFALAALAPAASGGAASGCPAAWAAGWQKLADKLQAPVYCPRWMPNPLDAKIGGDYQDIYSVGKDRSYLVSFLAHGDLPLPALALVVSGGHTSLYEVPEEGEHRLLGRTRDDAAGEAFDKVAKLLGLGYPGGPVIDRLAEGANDRAVEFAVARIKDGRGDFSFSGIKTAVLLHVRREGIPPLAGPSDVPGRVRDLVASFQRTVVTALVRGLVRAAREHHPRSLILTGGVAANSLLRREGERAARDLGLPIFIPPLSLTTDNAAMIGAAGFVALRRGVRADFALNAEPHLPLG